VTVSTLYYLIEARDSTVSGGSDNRVTGLTPSVAQLKAVGSLTALSTALAVVTEVGLGNYQVAYDPVTNGEAFLQLDLGSSLSNYSDRFPSLLLTKDGAIIATYADPLARDLAAYGTANTLGLLARMLFQTLGMLNLATVSDTTATATSFKVTAAAGSALPAAAGALVRSNPPAVCFVLSGTGEGDKSVVTGYTPLGSGLYQVTLSPGLKAAPDDGASVMFM
jgi:hypothetical protein